VKDLKINLLFFLDYSADTPFCDLRSKKKWHNAFLKNAFKVHKMDKFFMDIKISISKTYK